MFIRCTTTNTKKNKETYHTYRLVESIRYGNKVRQHTLLNLGKNFDVPRDLWPDLARRIDDIINGQNQIWSLSEELERIAQRYAASILQSQTTVEETSQSSIPEFNSIDLDTLELSRPRSIGLEHVILESIKKLNLDKKIGEIVSSKHQLNAALGILVGRMVQPGSELSTHYWLQNHTGLGELLNYDFEGLSLTRLYEINDLFIKHKEEIENHLFSHECSLFQLEETISLYDLTNTFFEGSAVGTSHAKRGHSKEKRTDCPLVTLGLVLDSSGFPKRSKIFSGNVSESSTLKEMIINLSNGQLKESCPDKTKPIIVMDAGIATEENVTWLKENQYKFIVVSRKRHREFNEEFAKVVKNEINYKIMAQKIENPETGEIELYCHSSKREDKEEAINNRFISRFEEALIALNEGLHKKGCTKKYEKVIEKIGRLKEKNSKASKYYEITVTKDEETNNATKVEWNQHILSDSTTANPGVYCLRTNVTSWDESRLWKTYTMLTDLEAVFRSLKTELGLRPIFHQKTERTESHLFISLLAYHVVHTIRHQLKKKDIHLSWSGLRNQLRGQVRVTVSMKREDQKMIHVRKSTHPEPRQQTIYDALEIKHHPGRTVKNVPSTK